MQKDTQMEQLHLPLNDSQKQSSLFDKKREREIALKIELEKSKSISISEVKQFNKKKKSSQKNKFNGFWKLISTPKLFNRKKRTSKRVRKYHAKKYETKKDIRGQVSGVFIGNHQSQYNRIREHQGNFQLKLKKRRPLWQEMTLFLAVSLIAWGASQVGMNYPAYSQIAEFKFNTLKASLIPTPSTTPTVAEENTQPQYTKVDIVDEPEYHEEIKPVHYARRVFGKMEVLPSDNRIYIPRLNKNIPLITVPNHQNWNQLEKNIQKGLQEGVVVHPVSRNPGVNGNFFLTGHSSYYPWDQGRFKDVFALLHEVKVNDTVWVYWEGKKYKYKMEVKKVIPPTNTDVLNQPDDRSIITLMTCTPVGTNKNRLILQGRLVEVQ